MLRQRLDDVRQRIHAACQRAGRDPASVTLVAVTKSVPPAVIQEAVHWGLRDLGENRVQEARQKQDALGSRLKALGGFGLEPTASSLQPVRWHLIGHLQRNKAKRAVEVFDAIHSVDSLALIDELERQAARCQLQAASQNARFAEIFVQVNISGEATKFGCRPHDAKELARAVTQQPHLRFRGFMTIAPFSDNAEGARPHFRLLRALRDEVAGACHLPPEACSLSMGMSNDFEVAIEEGADIVRIGTAIFGERAL